MPPKECLPLKKNCNINTEIEKDLAWKSILSSSLQLKELYLKNAFIRLMMILKYFSVNEEDTQE